MRFSVIMPLYNKEPYVGKAIQSILAQSCTDFELIVMDDGSKDDSWMMAYKAMEGFSNCHIYKQANSGVSVARNNAIALSQGKYLCFLDADDWWEPTFLEEISKLVEEYPDSGIYGTNYTIVNETKHKTRVAPIGVDLSFNKGYINYCQVYAKTLAMPLWTGAVCVPRHVFDEMKGFPEGIRLGEDFLLWIRISLKYKVVFLNEPLSYYNQDVDAVNRGVGKLHSPEQHMLWNLGFLEEEERNNSDYKQLIDNLRTYGLYPYYLSKDYHDVAKKELEKVDWNRQPEKRRRQYQQPLFWARIKYKMGAIGVSLKQRLLRVI